VTAAKAGALGTFSPDLKLTDDLVHCNTSSNMIKMLFFDDTTGRIQIARVPAKIVERDKNNIEGCTKPGP